MISAAEVQGQINVKGNDMATDGAFAINASKDERNIRLINKFFAHVTFLNYGFSPPRAPIPLETAEQRDYFVRVMSRRVIFLGLSVATLFFGLWASSGSAPAPSPPTFTAAGTVSSVQLHETALSTTTSVVTTAGTFQVRGAVTASAGDVAEMKHEHLTRKSALQESLCVKSKFKEACYPLI